MWPAYRSRRRGDHFGGPAAELIVGQHFLNMQRETISRPWQVEEAASS
jgi:hypothetical protein